MSRFFFWLLLAAGFTLAFQDAFSSLKLTRESYESNIKDYVTRELSDGPWLRLAIHAFHLAPTFLGDVRLCPGSPGEGTRHGRQNHLDGSSL